MNWLADSNVWINYRDKDKDGLRILKMAVMPQMLSLFSTCDWYEKRNV